MTRLELHTDGYQKILYAYINPYLSYELILGKPWIEMEDVLYHAKEHYMEIREALLDDRPLRVQEKTSQMQQLQAKLNISSLSAGVLLMAIRKSVHL